MPNFRLLAKLILVFFWFAGYASAATELNSSAQHIYLAEDQQVLPHRYRDIPSWLDKLTPVEHVALTGGSYWLVKKLDIKQPDQWLASVDGSTIENIDYYLYSEGNQLRHLSSGYLHPYEYLFSYARHIDTPTLGGYWLITRISSRYYTDQPQLNFAKKTSLSQLYYWRASLINLCLGGLLLLALYHGAVGFIQQDRVFSYFSAYLFSVSFSLAFIFQLPAQLLQWQQLHLQQLPLLCIPIFGVVFYCRFLSLPQHAPGLWLICRYLVVLCLGAIPIASIWLSYSVLISYSLLLTWLLLALASALVCWRRGSKPAPVFVLANLLLLIPALLVVVSFTSKSTNTLLAADILLLLSCTLSGFISSLALHYKFRQLALESIMVTQQLHQERDAARLDALTGLQNRYAFNEYVSQQLSFEPGASTCLALVDIDYLKSINDQAGHQEGDRFIKLVAEALSMVLSNQVELFRIGGDEFAIFTSQLSSDALQQKLHIVDKVILLNGSAHSGISVGFASTDECSDAEELFYRADMNMYQQKAQRKRKTKLAVVPDLPSQAD